MSVRLQTVCLSPHLEAGHEEAAHALRGTQRRDADDLWPKGEASCELHGDIPTEAINKGETMTADAGYVLFPVTASTQPRAEF